MKFRLHSILFIILLWVSASIANAQITGTIVDAETGDSIPYASVTYKGHNIAVSSNAHGKYKIQKHNGWKLTFSAVGYKNTSITIDEKTPEHLDVKLVSKFTDLSEVVVKSKKSKYSRKNNPAVELMKRVIAAKKHNKLENNDFYQYDNYEKLTLSLNEITPDQLTEGFFSNKSWLSNQVEPCLYNNKLILPILVNEKVTRKLYRKNPQTEKDYILGERSQGINDLFETGDILDILVEDIFTEVDIYDDQIRLLRQHFTSPIGKDAISFYRFYIVDTVKVERDSCFHLTFIPNNQQDFGFRGDLFILKDTTLHVKKVALSIPQRSDVNFVENLIVTQEYSQLDNHEWVLTKNDMVIEMRLNKKIGKFLVVRTSTRSDYSFEEIDKKQLKGSQKEIKHPDAEIRDNAFWQDHRKVMLTRSERQMGRFIKEIKSLSGFGWIMTGFKAVVENFIETGSEAHPSKFDIGPINTIISNNFIDGYRARVSGQTTANLNRHLFFGGYYAHGFRTKNDYYKANITYSFNRKSYLPNEYPIHKLSFTSSYDICSPSDKFVHTDKDNVFTAFKWSKVQKMMFYKRNKLEYEREENWGFITRASIKTEENEATGGLLFKPLSDYAKDGIQYNGGTWEDYYTLDEKSMHNGKIHTAEFHIEFEFSPGRTYINTKQHRIPVNREAPIFNIAHTIGFKGFLGGEYSYHATEAMVFKRIWLNSWGKMECRLKGGIQWSTVPYPILIAPAANLSYIMQDQTFNLINNMEFLNDRYTSFDWKWDINGKIFNRLPIIKHLKWRELLGFRLLWGSLSDKNNPMLNENWNSSVLMAFPEGCYLMNSKKPYMEAYFGIHNLFRFFQIAYVRRLNYLDLPTASKHGVRIAFKLEF